MISHICPKEGKEEKEEKVERGGGSRDLEEVREHPIGLEGRRMVRRDLMGKVEREVAEKEETVGKEDRRARGLMVVSMVTVHTVKVGDTLPNGVWYVTRTGEIQVGVRLPLGLGRVEPMRWWRRERRSRNGGSRKWWRRR